jgi:hypothetical protein
MSSPFGELLTDLIEPMIDATFADEEGFEFRPMTTADSVNGRPIADPARKVVPDVPAIYDDRPMGFDESSGKRDRPGFATTTPQISVQVSALPWEIVRGDEAKRNATGAVYRVTEIEPDGQTRVNLQVTLQTIGT